MKIFFASCINDESVNQKKRIDNIDQTLLAGGHKIYTYVYDQSKLNDVRSFGQLSELILTSDVYVAEMSIASQTLGFQIAFALSSTKPCLYLYHESTNGKPDAPLASHPSRLLKIERYNEQDLAKKLTTFLEYGQKQLTTARTSFMSTREIDDFLDSESARLGIHKAELIRQVLHNYAAANTPRIPK